jgi:dTDP-4-amino-4,6-dideoxygalactose transaminase
MYCRQIRNPEILLPGQRSAGEHAYHLFAVRSERRNSLRNFLKAKGIGTNIHYPYPIHRMPGYRGRFWLPASGLPESERAACEVLSLPLYPEMSAMEVGRVAKAVNGWTAL